MIKAKNKMTFGLLLAVVLLIASLGIISVAASAEDSCTHTTFEDGVCADCGAQRITADMVTVADAVYNGEVQLPTESIVVGGVVLVRNVDYSVQVWPDENYYRDVGEWEFFIHFDMNPAYTGDTIRMVQYITCDHTYSAHTTGTDTGDGKHSFTCTLCGESGIEDHRGGEGTANCEEGKACELCGGRYGETDPTEHKTFDENFRCTNCEGYEKPELSASGYYLIYNASELFWFAEQVNSGNGNVMASIENDIDLGGVPWTPIGTANNPFRGFISGKNGGSVIKGLNVVATDSYAGFIGKLDINDSTAANNGVDNLVLYGEIAIEEDDVCNVGGIAGYSNAMIRRCISYVNITQSKSDILIFYVGGVVGCAEGEDSENMTEISRCAYFGAINLPDVTVVGGILGQAFGYVKTYDCANYGSIKATSRAGGIVGYMDIFVSKVYNCLNIGEIVTASEDDFGAIVGYIDGTENSVTNNYYLDSSCDNGIGYGTGEAVAVTAEQLASGEVTWLLNGESSSGYWWQDIDYYKPEAYPQISGSCYVYYTTACDGVGTVYTNYSKGQHHISDGTTACVNCGAEVFVVIDGVAYYDGGDITNTGLDIGQLWNQNLDYNKMYFKAGEGYALLTYEDIKVDMMGKVETRERRRVLTLHNGTVDLRGTEAEAIFKESGDLKVIFEGENNLYCNENGGYCFTLNSSSWDTDTLIFAGKENAVLNIYGYGYEEKSYFEAIDAGILVMESGEVNVIVDTEDLSIPVSISSLLYVNEGASLTLEGGYLMVGASLEDEALQPINVAGKLNAVELKLEDVPNEDETTYTTYMTVTVHGNAIYSKGLDLSIITDGTELNSTLNIPEGATLTVSEGVTLDIQFYDSTNVKGTIAGEYTCDHTGGVYSCTVGYICDFCNAEYTEPRGHEMQPWSRNETEHYRTCYQCYEYTETEEHDFSDWEHSENEYFHERTCSVCNYSESAEHNYAWEDLGEEHKGTCQDCKYEFTEEHRSYSNYRPVDADTHVMTCGGCQFDIIEGHQYSLFEKVDDETHKKYCYNCNFEVIENHSYVYYQPNGDGDCLNRGTMTGHCDGFCGMEHTKEDDSTGNGHDLEDWTYDEENPEQHYSKCDNYGCDHLETEEHSFGDWTVDYEPTATEDGLEYRTCEVCNYEEERNIPALGESDDGVGVAPSESESESKSEVEAPGESESENESESDSKVEEPSETESEVGSETETESKVEEPTETESEVGSETETESKVEEPTETETESKVENPTETADESETDGDDTSGGCSSSVGIGLIGVIAFAGALFSFRKKD